MKQNPTIYKISKQHTLENVHEGVLKHLRQNNKTFKEKDFQLVDFEVKLIVIESDDKDSEWSEFFPSEYIEDISLQYKMPSLVLLISTEVGIYSVVGGAFYQYVLPFLDNSYGLNTYSRIMNPIQDRIITINTRGVTGLRAGMKEQFKDNYRIMDYIKFGKIPTELKIRLSNETADLYFDQFLTSRSPQIILSISSGFNINKKLSFIELGNLIKILVHIESLTPNDFFSSYKEIDDKSFISKSLAPALLNKLFNERIDIIDGKTSNFDVCYPNKVEDFYSADEYEIKIQEVKYKFEKIGRTSDKSEILRILFKYLAENGYDRNLKSFNKKIYNTHILTYKNQKSTHILKTTLIHHLNTEIYIPDVGTFIYLDSKWYRLREIFIEEMNDRCAEIISNNNLNNTILNEKWQLKVNGKREDEDVYNAKYLKDNYLVLDGVIIDSIELADVIHIQNNWLYLCHVKYGFSTEIRELYSQIVLSARRLKNDLKDENNIYIKAIYKQLEEKGRNGGLTEKEFVQLFKTKNIKYVMSITSHLKNKSVTNQIKKYPSNIAKLSLIQCFTEMATEYYSIEMEIIDNSECF
ncbi:MAG: hypothetical protein K0S23_921 [Fluviicola sp.]|jgi:uncharacterized protein (TIGR04141 family)|uniref:DUF6119 family protein n=1 Tax=Fluviicola sp. TaxID=1917219 RepID=UPI0026083A0B|nr:DUF6119 family protein [Fluviicola sp.]MDF3026614.1 hypothetical protein [Fluviicola sp.]